MSKRIVLALTLGLLTTAAYVPIAAERARWTMGDMTSWRTALEAYARDHGTHPPAATPEELRAAVQPHYIAQAPMHDAWGTPYRYERTAAGFRLVSAGADRTFDAASWSTRARSKSLADDAVATNERRWLTRSWDLE